jgi:ubiquitin-like modifier-activating enzyme ATG7
MWSNAIDKRDSSKLTQFLLITFSDLKKYQYYYWFAFPAFVAKPAWEISENGWKGVDEQLSTAQVSSPWCPISY